ncbi:tRNA pseudouridine(55) synthase TruB [Chitinasiproducens palmae]|uniref:tRNA pseudouridine(55) synthase TruB n=1 Tax=Chitinasiproducens palmae TaxID=1770053 RepID=UPI001F2B0DC2|nr:tRNA pseudouridine(55) synthase TruB [Chitinasiproducens palmae]
MAKPPKGRPRAQQARRPRRLVDGVLLLDKPVGLSSNDALVRAKRVFDAKKAGHTGTLDPLASGLLPLCFGEATKFSQDLLDADKRYLAHVRLGVTTDTGDAEGQAVLQRDVTCTAADVHAVLPRFRGAIEQVPPMYSALKRDGRPLYAYARAGETVERAARAVTIHALELVDSVWDDAPTLMLDVLCSKGTYVRTLAEDIGEALGCGAHLTGLRRTAVGSLTLDDAVPLALLQNDAEPTRHLRPVDALLSTFPAVVLDPSEAQRFGQGQRLRLEAGRVEASAASAADAATAADATDAGDRRVRVYDGAGCLLGLAVYAESVLSPQRLLVRPIDEPA